MGGGEEKNPGDSQQRGADLQFKAFGTETNIRNVKSLNTILTALTLAATIAVVLMVWFHKDDDRSTRQEFLTTIKELTAAQRDATAVAREQNCLLLFPQDQRMIQKDSCKQVSGVR